MREIDKSKTAVAQYLLSINDANRTLIYIEVELSIRSNHIVKLLFWLPW